jgi:hypothetical protein
MSVRSKEQVESAFASSEGMSPRRNRLWSLLVTVAASVLLGVTGCGGDRRSTARFCSTLNTGTDELRTAAQQTASVTKQNPLLGLIAAFGNIGDFAQFLDRLDKTAPPEIRDDMDVVDTDFHASLDSSGQAAGEALTGNPAGIAQLVFKELLHANAYKRVDQFAAANCGLAIFGGPTSSG